MSCFLGKAAEAFENNELIRASVIEKIASFIEWPDLPPEQFNLCVFDDTSLLPALETYYADSHFNARPIKIVTFKHFQALLQCQIIYLAASETRQLENILRITGDHPVLIVTEKKDNVSEGAHADFYVEDSRLHLEVNRTALVKSHLKASYHLLGVARIVE